MTTIAYRNGIMAADSACSDDNQILSLRIQKIHRLKSGGLFGQAGDDDNRQLIDLLNDVKTPSKLPSREAITKTFLDFSAILILPKGKVYHVFLHEPDPDQANSRWDGGLYEVSDGYFAVGSGAVSALSAMDAGASARDAVLIACKRDFYTRSPVHTVPLLVK
jgi:hypothetical protein